MDRALSALNGNPNRPFPGPPPRVPARLPPPLHQAAPECPCGSCLGPGAALAPPIAGLPVPPLREWLLPGSPSRSEPRLSPCCRPGLQQPCGAAHRRKPLLRPPRARLRSGPSPNPPEQPKEHQPVGRSWFPADNTKRLFTEMFFVYNRSSDKLRLKVLT